MLWLGGAQYLSLLSAASGTVCVVCHVGPRRLDICWVTPNKIRLDVRVLLALSLAAGRSMWDVCEETADTPWVH